MLLLQPLRILVVFLAALLLTQGRPILDANVLSILSSLASIVDNKRPNYLPWNVANVSSACDWFPPGTGSLGCTENLAWPEPILDRLYDDFKILEEPINTFIILPK